MTQLVLILGDQLSDALPALQVDEPSKTVVLMCEVKEEATYVKHHKKKIALIFSAMRHFAESLKSKGYNVDYVDYHDKNNTHTIQKEVARAIKKHKPKHLHLTFPGEYRLTSLFESWVSKQTIPTTLHENLNFLITPTFFKEWQQENKTLRMEFFYRMMRKKFNILVKNEKPIGDKWNFDAENRKTNLGNKTIPTLPISQPDDITKTVLSLVEKEFSSHFGAIDDFCYAVTRRGALHALNAFIEERLPSFGDFQDAMKTGEPFLFHSVLSLYINLSLLNPMEVIEKALKAYQQKKVPLNAVEGFIRQILGWREFIRGVYWLHMPEYADKNYFLAKRQLPEFFWDGKTKMNCLSQSFKQTHEHAYAHHIQRLMVIGNFALLASLQPKAVSEWYLIVYADAFEWVELPNVMGMILYADAGTFASKPYAASGAYINKMSDYCKDCRFNVKEKTGENACPFNFLYWNFMIKHEKKLKDNPRMGLILSHLKKLSASEKKKISDEAAHFLDKL